MGLTRQTLFMALTIAALSVVVVALAIALIHAQNSQADDNSADIESPISGEKTTSEDDNFVPRFPWEKSLRLPRSVYPNHYDLYLNPDLQEGTFSGRVDIHVNSSESRDFFLVHTKYLTIQKTELYEGTTKSESNLVDIEEAFEYEKNEFWVIKTSAELQPGDFIISIEFDGSLTKGLVGFYRSFYTNGAGEKTAIASSKFQPTYARRAFPCLDEPSFKSTFTVTLVRPSEKYIALSNMPKETEVPNTPSEGLTEVKFEKSVAMVTYLVCFVVCDFAFEETLTQIHNTKFRVFATPTQRQRMSYALNAGANITDYFEDYFQIPYPLPKQDMIAIPDFTSGAMEHWGLITYRESNILYDEKESSSYNRRRVCTVVSHELAHQWFGNLMTLSWWDDLWLNEGFASYIEYKGVAQFETDWDFEAQFLILDLERAFKLDSAVNSHPIIQTVEDPNQITEIFDGITYSKGASVLRMLENFMGAESFRVGISNFLKKFKYANAVTQDLWNSLEEVSDGLNITQIMDTWTRQMGFPVLNVEKNSDTLYRLTQSRYLKDSKGAEQGEQSPYGYKWEVPVTYITSSDPKNVQQVWLSRDQDHLDLEVPPGNKWVKFNVGHYGFYRVNYPKEIWQEFSELLMKNHEVFSTSDRGSLLADAFALAESGHVEYSIPLAMIQYLKKEDSLVPWTIAYRNLDNLEDFLSDTEVYPLYRKYMLSLVSDQYSRLGWKTEGSSYLEAELRYYILAMACKNGHDNCLKEAGKLFNNWIENKIYIHPDLRILVYKYGMQSVGNARSWDITLNRYTNEINSQEKSKLMSGLAYTTKPWLLKRLLLLAKNDTIVRQQDYLSVLSRIAGNPVGNPLVWNFMRNEWPYLVDRFTLNSRYLGRMLEYITDDYATELGLREVMTFIERNPEAGAGKRSRKNAVENIQNNINWLGKHQDTIQSWLQTNIVVE